MNKTTMPLAAARVYTHPWEKADRSIRAKIVREKVAELTPRRC